MAEAWHNSTDDIDDAEADAIDVLKARLTLAEAGQDEVGIAKLRDELSEARMKRVKRVTDENWDMLERLVGHRLRRG